MVRKEMLFVNLSTMTTGINRILMVFNHQRRALALDNQSASYSYLICAVSFSCSSFRERIKVCSHRCKHVSIIRIDYLLSSVFTFDYHQSIHRWDPLTWSTNHMHTIDVVFVDPADVLPHRSERNTQFLFVSPDYCYPCNCCFLDGGRTHRAILDDQGCSRRDLDDYFPLSFWQNEKIIVRRVWRYPISLFVCSLDRV